MPTLDWKVQNALSRDVERQHLNKILADILSSFTTLEDRTTGPGSTIGNIKDIVGEMVVGNTEAGISVDYNLADQVLDFVISSFIITLSGDVTGEGVVTANSNVTIPVTIDPSKVGIPDAPIDNNAYWRRGGQWEAINPAVDQLGSVVGPGFLGLDSTSNLTVRVFEAAAGELTVVNGDSEAGNPLYGLADLADTGVGVSPIQLFTRDAKGRIDGTQDADTDDLPEGSNLYFTDERAQDSVGTILLDTADIDFSYDDTTPTISAVLTPAIHASLDLADTSLQPGDNISELVNDVGFLESVQAGTNITIDNTDPLNPIINATGGGGGTVDSVVGGTGIDVDATDPVNPILNLDAASVASLSLADTSVQPGDLAAVATSGSLQDLLNAPGSFITGFQMTWVSGTAVTVQAGGAYIQSLGVIVNSPSAIAKAGLALSNSTWYHLYFYLNAGVPDIDVSTTAPAAAYSSTARSKTGDTSRRYIGSMRTGTSGGFLKVVHSPASGTVMYQVNISTAPLALISNGMAVASTNITAAGSPATSHMAFMYVENSSASVLVYIANPDIGAVSPGNALTFVRPAQQLASMYTTSSAQQINYIYISAPATGLNVWQLGYVYER